jgi:hypothetical protein
MVDRGGTPPTIRFAKNGYEDDQQRPENGMVDSYFLKQKAASTAETVLAALSA